jgi:uncharacterized pyridoxamine 5'-phosphate oxidase family protein
MPATQPVAELDERFSSPGAEPRRWPEVVQALEEAEIFWLSTVRRDGRPHVTPLPAMWLDDELYFCTGPAEQKAKNLAGNDRCALTTGDNEFLAGLDVVVEGRASRVTDGTLLERLAAMWKEKLDWGFDVVDGAFRERPSESPGGEDEPRGTAHVFVVVPDKVLAFGKGEPFTQTRYRFER